MLRQRTSSASSSLDNVGSWSPLEPPPPRILAVNTLMSSTTSELLSAPSVMDQFTSADSPISEEGEEIPLDKKSRRGSLIELSDGQQLQLNLHELPAGARTFMPWCLNKANDRNKLLKYSELPAWQRDNNFIRSGYRQETNSYWKAWKSYWYVHNESGNMWTHAIGAAIFALITIWTYAFEFPRAQVQWSTVKNVEAWLIGCFFAGAIACLSLSSFFHCFCCHSLKVSIKWNKMDYVGIVALIVGSFVPAFYYAFYCYPQLQWAYVGVLGVLGLICIGIALADRFATPQFRWFRTSMFLFLGCSAIVPVFHAFIKYGVYYCFNTLHFGFIIAEAVLYVSGALLYGFRWPERQWPGKFDFVGTSHQIFHALVVIAACCHYMGVVLTFSAIHGIGGVASSCSA